MNIKNMLLSILMMGAAFSTSSVVVAGGLPFETVWGIGKAGIGFCMIGAGTLGGAVGGGVAGGIAGFAKAGPLGAVGGVIAGGAGGGVAGFAAACGLANALLEEKSDLSDKKKEALKKTFEKKN